MFCKNCGAPVEANARFCKECGTCITLSNPTFQSTANSFLKRKSFCLIILFLAIAIICTTGYFSYRKYSSSLGYFDSNKWGLSIESFKKKYPDGHEYDRDSTDTATSFSIPISSFEGVRFNAEESVSFSFQDGKFYYVQLLFRTDDPFKDADAIAESLTRKLGTPSKSEPQYSTYHWDTSKSNVEVTVLSRTAVAVWYGDISSPYNKLHTVT